MKKYELTISGYVVVEVEAESPESAIDVALKTTVAGDLYNYEVDAVEEVS